MTRLLFWRLAIPLLPLFVADAAYSQPLNQSQELAILIVVQQDAAKDACRLRADFNGQSELLNRAGLSWKDVYTRPRSTLLQADIDIFSRELAAFQSRKCAEVLATYGPSGSLGPKMTPLP